MDNHLLHLEAQWACHIGHIQKQTPLLPISTMATLLFQLIEPHTLTPPFLSRLTFNPSTNPTALPIFHMYPDSNHFSLYSPQIQAPVRFCLGNCHRLLADVLASALVPCSVPRWTFSKISSCVKKTKSYLLKAHLPFKNKLTCSLWLRTRMPSLPSLESPCALFLMPPTTHLLHTTICLLSLFS